MLKIIFKWTLFVLLLLFPINLKFNLLIMSYVPTEKMFSVLKNDHFMTLDINKALLFSSKEMSEIKIPDFADFSKNGYLIKYDKMGTYIDLYHLEKKIFNWDKTYNYPRIKYPFLFLFSSDLTRVSIYHLKKSLKKPIHRVVTDDMITCWDGSENGENVIIGDISGRYFIYNTIEKKAYSGQLKNSRINYIKGVSISSNGDYVVLGSLYPEILLFKNVKKDDKLLLRMPHTGRSRRLVMNFSRFTLIEKDDGVFILDKNKNQFIEHTIQYKFYDGEEIYYQGQVYLVLLFKDEIKNSVKIELFMEGKYKYSILVENAYLPKIYHKGKNFMIIWAQGVIKI